MSRMAPPSEKKRKLEDGIRGKTSRPTKRIRKQRDYHSSEDESEPEQDFTPISLDDSDGEVSQNAAVSEADGKLEELGSPSEDSDQDLQIDEEEGSDQDEDEEEDDENGQPAGAATRKATSKRNDPDAFSTSMSKILSTKLSQSMRKDPVLSRSREAHKKGSSLASERLEKKVKAKQRAEKKESMQKGRVTDVLGLESGTTGEVAEEEKKLRKIAQRGVVKLFNAVRAAQVRAEQAAREEKKKGTVGMGKREEKTKEMSKDAFLTMINGQKKTGA